MRERAKSASCRVDLERSWEFTGRWEARSCGSPIQWILRRRLRDWDSYSCRAVSHSSSSCTPDMLSNFLWPETACKQKCKTFCLGCCLRIRWRMWVRPLRIPSHFLTRSDTLESHERCLSNRSPTVATVWLWRTVSAEPNGGTSHTTTILTRARDNELRFCSVYLQAIEEESVMEWR